MSSITHHTVMKNTGSQSIWLDVLRKGDNWMNMGVGNSIVEAFDATDPDAEKKAIETANRLRNEWGW